MDTKGYTLVELLLALSIALLGTTLLYSLSMGMRQIQAALSTPRNRAIMQMRYHYAMARNHAWDTSAWSFDLRDQRMQSYFRERRLVVTPGWQVWMDQIDDLRFEAQNGCLWVIWWENMQEHEAVLGCE
ncbi:MAG: prepilin-type N-terminal cleavage/methylation domain-containing protein [Erysipelotrichaceae bacterium]